MNFNINDLVLFSFVMIVVWLLFILFGFEFTLISCVSFFLGIYLRESYGQ